MTDDTKSDAADYDALASACEDMASTLPNTSLTREELFSAARTLRALSASRSETAEELEAVALGASKQLWVSAKLLRTTATLLRSPAPDLSAVRAEAFEEAAAACEENCADATEQRADAARRGDVNGMSVWSASVIACKADAKRIRALSPAAESKPKGGVHY